MHRPMNPLLVGFIIKVLKQAVSDQEREDFIIHVFRDRTDLDRTFWLTCDTVKQILDQFVYRSTKEIVYHILRPMITDLQNGLDLEHELLSPLLQELDDSVSVTGSIESPSMASTGSGGSLLSERTRRLNNAIRMASMRRSGGQSPSARSPSSHMSPSSGRSPMSARSPMSGSPRLARVSEFFSSAASVPIPKLQSPSQRKHANMTRQNAELNTLDIGGLREKLKFKTVKEGGPQPPEILTKQVTKESDREDRTPSPLSPVSMDRSMEHFLPSSTGRRSSAS